MRPLGRRRQKERRHEVGGTLGMLMERAARILVLSDGSLPALVACAHAREAAAIGMMDAGKSPAVIAYGCLGQVARVEAVSRQAELLGLELIQAPAVLSPTVGSAGLRETLELTAACDAGARAGCDLVTWPAHAAMGDALDLDRIAAIADRAVLVSRLVGIDAASHGVPGIRVEAPFADFTDRQIADLAAELELPTAACWWHEAAGDDAEAQRERRRWMSALAAVGQG